MQKDRLFLKSRQVHAFHRGDEIQTETPGQQILKIDRFLGWRAETVDFGKPGIERIAHHLIHAHEFLPHNRKVSAYACVNMILSDAF